MLKGAKSAPVYSFDEEGKLFFSQKVGSGLAVFQDCKLMIRILPKKF